MKYFYLLFLPIFLNQDFLTAGCTSSKYNLVSGKDQQERPDFGFGESWGKEILKKEIVLVSTATTVATSDAEIEEIIRSFNPDGSCVQSLSEYLSRFKQTGLLRERYYIHENACSEPCVITFEHYLKRLGNDSEMIGCVVKHHFSRHALNFYARGLAKERDIIIQCRPADHSADTIAYILYTCNKES